MYLSFVSVNIPHVKINTTKYLQTQNIRVYLNHQTNGVNQMSYCHVSNQIAQHCNEAELLCTECGEPMYFEGETLKCDCGHKIEKEEPEVY